MRNLIATIAIAAAAAGVLAGCEGQNSSAKAEQATRNAGYDQLVKSQPAKTMPYSPTREAINGWVETWGKPGKVSYVYLQNSEGKLTGYYVMKGLPVSYCSALAPNYEIIDNSNGAALAVPAPGLDGTYEASGAACNTYYGFDAGTGAYLEYTAGLGINVLLYDQPLPQSGSIQPLGPTTTDKLPQGPK